MAELESLVARIKKEGQERADSVKEKAKEQSKLILSETAAEMEVFKGKALIEADRQAALSSERIVESQKQQARNLILSAKLETVEKVYAAALQKLNSMQKDKFMEYCKEAVASYSPDGDEIILPSRYGFQDIDWLNSHLKKIGQKGNLKLYKGERSIEGGFVLTKSGIERNNTFEALLEFNRFDMEGAVLDILFGKGAPS